MRKILLTFFTMSIMLLATEVTVSIVPQKYFVEKIAGDKVNVNVMVKPGFSPASYEPKTSQMRKLANSKVYFSIGVPFENAWLKKFQNSNKTMLMVDTSKGIKKREMEAHEHHEEEEHGHEKHGHDEKHDNHEDEEKHHEHSALDPHIWLDPVLVKIQAKNIYDTLVLIDEKNRDFYKKNYKNFINELNVFHDEIKNILKPYEHKAFMVFHPSWGYFADRYHLEEIAVEILGKEPKPAQVVELIKEAKEHNIKIVFVAPQFSQKGAKTISQNIDGNVVNLDPLSYEWKNNLLKTAQEIKNSYK